ncbi:MAG: alanine racemase [Lachnospiraceae bacterium]|nr:alanine racemase [Lachnospiraceae bacterium]
MNGNLFVEIDNGRIEHNARVMCETFPHKYNIGVVKGNAYGHGYGVIPAMVRGGINAFAVARVKEGVAVREYEKTLPVILLEPVSPEELPICAENDLSICVNDMEALKEAEDSKLSLKIHLKIDSGMSRLGFRDRKEVKEAADRINGNSLLTLEGIFTHFHTSGAEDREYADNRARFEELTKDLELDKIPMVHVDKTQTLILHDTPAYANGARIGIALYGFPTVYDFPDTLKGKLKRLRRNFRNAKNHVEPCNPVKTLDLKEAFTLKTRVIQVKDIDPGDYVGYGFFHRAENIEHIAVVDVGYADGIGRKRMGSHMAINGNKYRIVGAVGMSMCQLLTDGSVKRGDLVDVLGGGIPIRTITVHNGTTMYELMTNIDSSIPRIYTER